MQKEIKQWGNSLVVVFDPEDKRIIGLEKGDVIDFTINGIQTKEPENETS